MSLHVSLWLRIPCYQSLTTQPTFKGCVRYIIATLFFRSKREHLSNLRTCFLFHLKIIFRSQENQILELCIFKFHDVIKYLRKKQEIHFTE